MFGELNMKRHSIAVAILSYLLAWIFVFGTGAFSQNNQQKVSIAIKVEKIIKVEKGKNWVTKRVSAQDAKKDDILIYTITYTNTAKEAVSDVSVMDPIPQGTEYIAGSASGENAEITFSMDGGKTFGALPLKYKKSNPDGSYEMKVATPSMFTHVKWQIKKKVAPGKSGRVYFKVKVK